MDKGNRGDAGMEQHRGLQDALCLQGGQGRREDIQRRGGHLVLRDILPAERQTAAAAHRHGIMGGLRDRRSAG